MSVLPNCSELAFEVWADMFAAFLQPSPTCRASHASETYKIILFPWRVLPVISKILEKHVCKHFIDYADDSTLYASAPTLVEVEEKIRPDIDAVSMCAKENKMKMHPAKTKYSIISTKQKIANSAKQSLDLSVDGM